MSSIEDAANVLAPVLDAEQPDSIVRLLEAAGKRVAYEQELVTRATAGSEAPETDALQGALAQIASGVGELAAAATAAVGAKEALLINWGLLPGSTTVPQPTINETSHTKVPSKQERDKKSLDTPLGEDIENVGPVKLAQLKCRGVWDYRDAIVAGKAYIAETSRVGPHAANSVAKHIAETTDETVQDTAEFADILRVCDTLGDVSWAALHSGYMTAEQAMLLGWRHMRISVNDLVTKPRDALIIRDKNDDELAMDRALAKYGQLVQDARKFADKFKKAKGQ